MDTTWTLYKFQSYAPLSAATSASQPQSASPAQQSITTSSTHHNSANAIQAVFSLNTPQPQLASAKQDTS